MHNLPSTQQEKHDGLPPVASRRPWERVLASLLTYSLACTSVISGTPAFAHARHTSQSLTAKMPPHERALQALNRLTFGPRPGDVERVEAIGVDRWIEQQLDPALIDDSALERRLDNYPAMRRSEQDLLVNFPSDALIRAASDGKTAIPGDATVRAIYADRIAAYQQKQAEQKQAAAATPDATAATNAPGQNTGVVNPQAAAAAPGVQNLPGILNLPPAARVARILTMPPAEFEAFEKALTGPQKRSLIDDLSPQQKETLLALKNPSQLVSGELLATRFLRDVYSNRQLEAVMTDFWLNHFNVYLQKGPYAPWYLVEYERNTVRPHAMGSFENLLVATAESPAMLTYLDNQQSIGPHSEAAQHAQKQSLSGQPKPNGQPKPKNDVGLNENYARELMELHTLGVDGGYTQQDVTQVAEVFTGWGVDAPNAAQKNGSTMLFNFNARRHEPGAKTVLGVTIPQSGQDEGLAVLHMLATSPVTARHISQQLAVRFVSDTPSPALINSMVQTWVSTAGDIHEVLRTMFASSDFWSKDDFRAKIKTPEEFVLSAVRATGGEVVKPAQGLQALNELGMPFFGCQTPNGYSWTSNAWVNTGDLLDRINIAINMANNKLGVATDMDGLMASLARRPLAGTQQPGTQQISPQQKESWLADALLNGPASPQTQSAILKQIHEATLTSATTQAGGVVKNGVAEKSGGAAMQTVVAKASPPEVPRRFRADLPDGNTPVPPPSDPEASIIAGLLLGSPDFQRR